MLLQITSGIGGPPECEFAVEKYANWLESLGGCIISKHKGSALVSIEDGEKYAGTVQWIWQSKIRPGHKRKNWFIQASIANSPNNYAPFDPKKIEWNSFRSGGAGGQYVNKTESAVRGTYLPTGDTTVCSDERSQHSNKRRATERLHDMYLARQLQNVANIDKDNWSKHSELVRGNAMLVFEGDDFKLKKSEVA